MERAAVADREAASERPVKVSILTPTRNRREFLPRALASVRAQSHQNWQLILYDVSDEPISYLVPTDPRIHYYRGEAAGPAADFQFCLEHATGDLIHPFADDDELPFHALATAVNAIGDAEWLVGMTELRGEDGSAFAYRGGDEYSLSCTLAGEYMLGGAVYWRKSLSDRVGGFRTEFDGAADFDLYVRFAHAARPVFVSDLLYLYTNHSGTDSNVRAANQQQQSAKVRSLL